MKKYCLLVLMTVAGVVWGQTQAPIEWGQRRSLNVQHVQRYGGGIALMGDTLICVSDSFGQGYTLMWCYSHNNGLEFSPWQLFEDQFWYNADINVCASGAHAVAVCRIRNRYDTHSTGWTLHSADGGVSWEVSQEPVYGRTAYSVFASGLQVIQRQSRWITDTSAVSEIMISNDGGITWNPPSIYTEEPYQGWPIAVTRDNILLLGQDWISGQPYPIVFVGDRSGQNWSLPYHISDSALVPEVLSIAGDSSSGTAIELSVLDMGEDPQRDLYIIRTTDGGETWEPPRALTSGGPIDDWYTHPEIFCRGKLWGVLWENYWGEQSEWGAHFSFSANHGKDWYPPSYIGLDVPSLTYSTGQFINNEVRVYWGWHTSYWTATGILTADTLPPRVQSLSIPPDTVRVNQVLSFAAEAVDQDTLSEVRLVLQWGNDSTRIPMISGENQQYQATFMVPEEGYYSYRIEAEDFWENVGCDPDTGWAVLVTDGWNEGSESSVLHPSSFSLSTYPNPFNATTTLSFSLLHTSSVSVTIFNLLGQAVYQNDLGMLNAGEHRQVFDASELPSGVYLARVQAGEHQQIRKMVLLK